MNAFSAATAPEEEVPGHTEGGPARSWAFLAALYLLLEAYLWFVVPRGGTAGIVAGAVVILLVMVGDPWHRGESAAGVGLTFRHFGGALRLLAGPTAVAVILLAGIHFLVPDAPRDHRFAQRFVQILPWALLQQGLLQATFNRRLVRLLRPGIRSSLVNGLFFAGMHLPGVLLTALTFLAGAWWSGIYQKRANLWALVLSHAVLSAAAQSVFPPEWTHGFRVGPGYYRWH